MPENYDIDIPEDPVRDINWQHLWEKNFKRIPIQKEKDWDKIAKKFRKWMEKDDYPEKLLNKITTISEYSVLDVGCGEGAITIPLAKKVYKVTAVDLSGEMLELLKEKAQKEGLDNITYIHGDLTDINLDTDKKYDIVIASRVLDGIIDIETFLKNINKIGKNIYITLKSPENRNYDIVNGSIFDESLSNHSGYIYFYNMLYQMGITANVEKLQCETINIYNNIDEAVDRYRWKIGDMNPENEEKLRTHLGKILVKKEDILESPYGKPDWILIWWKNG
jgi:ubiquinone/menaquinone biosynthesis C-methylase UbiE